MQGIGLRPALTLMQLARTRRANNIKTNGLSAETLRCTEAANPIWGFLPVGHGGVGTESLDRLLERSRVPKEMAQPRGRGCCGRELR
jgi:hypothetical protein